MDGPFTGSEELIAGFRLWQVKSMEEAIEGGRRCPIHKRHTELRPVLEADDFGVAFSPELREQEERIRERIEAKSDA